MKKVPDKLKREHVVAVRLPALVWKGLMRLASYRGEKPSTILRRWIIQGVRSELPPSWRSPLEGSERRPDSDSSKSPAGMPTGNVSDSAR